MIALLWCLLTRLFCGFTRGYCFVLNVLFRFVVFAALFLFACDVFVLHVFTLWL